MLILANIILEYRAEEGSPPKEDLQKYDNGYQAPAVEEEAKSNDINIVSYYEGI